MKMSKDKDKIITLQRKKIEELSRKLSAIEQENALLQFELLAQKAVRKQHAL